MSLRKLVVISILILCFDLSIQAQVNYRYGVEVTKCQKEGFYKTFEDLVANKIDETVGEFDPKFTFDGYNYVKLKDKNEKPINLKTCGYYGVTDGYNRYRIDGGKAMNMVCAGKKCLYLSGYMMNEWWIVGPKNKKGGPGAGVGSGSVGMYYSDGPDGKIISIEKWNNEKLIAKLLFGDDPVIADAYLNDKSDDYDPYCKKCGSDDIEKIIFYVTKYNASHK